MTTNAYLLLNKAAQDRYPDFSNALSDTLQPVVPQIRIGCLRIF